MNRPSHIPTTARRCATALLVLCSACFTSSSPRRAAIADTLRGETVTVHLTDGSSRTGELLGLQDSSLVLLVEQRVVVGRLVDVGDVSAQRASWRAIRPGTSEASAQLASASRFPFGVTASALSALLTSAKQTAPDPLIGQPR